MQVFKYVFINILTTFLRFIPIPTQTGLFPIGHPGPESPLLITGNYLLTVARLKRALQKCNLYLLVVNSKGINVWCAATGGHLTHHEVISGLKTSGVADRLRHRTAILPQLAATGIQTSLVQEKTGWTTTWGPVYAKDIPAFLDQAPKKSAVMQEVNFPIGQRIEMAVMWAATMSVLALIVGGIFFRQLIPMLLITAWILPLGAFLGFPWYGNWIVCKAHAQNAPKKALIIQIGLATIIPGVLFLAIMGIATLLLDVISISQMPIWTIVAFGTAFLLGIDLSGSTPVYKSGFHPERFFKVVLQKDKCSGAAVCEQVCPRRIFRINQKASMVHTEHCIQCGACIVQCPSDALYFRGKKGSIISPTEVRKYKLNLLGERANLNKNE